MDELQVLRDVTLFYNEAHAELRAAAKKPTAEDAERERDSGNTKYACLSGLKSILLNGLPTEDVVTAYIGLETKLLSMLTS